MTALILDQTVPHCKSGGPAKLPTPGITATQHFGCSNGKRLGKSSEIPRDLDGRNDEVDNSEVDGDICGLDPFSDAED